MTSGRSVRSYKYTPYQHGPTCTALGRMLRHTEIDRTCGGGGLGGWMESSRKNGHLLCTRVHRPRGPGRSLKLGLLSPRLAGRGWGRKGDGSRRTDRGRHLFSLSFGGGLFFRTPHMPGTFLPRRACGICRMRRKLYPCSPPLHPPTLLAGWLKICADVKVKSKPMCPTALPFRRLLNVK